MWWWLKVRIWTPTCLILCWQETILAVDQINKLLCCFLYVVWSWLIFKNFQNLNVTQSLLVLIEDLCGRKPKNPDEAHVDMGRTWETLHINNLSSESNQGPWSCQEAALSATPMCHSWTKRSIVIVKYVYLSYFVYCRGLCNLFLWCFSNVCSMLDS